MHSDPFVSGTVNTQGIDQHTNVKNFLLWFLGLLFLGFAHGELVDKETSRNVYVIRVVPD